MTYFRELPNLNYQSTSSDRSSSEDYVVVKNIFRRAKLRDDLKEHALSDAKTREFMATNYSTRKEVFNEMNKLLARFDKLEEKLDRWMEKQ